MRILEGVGIVLLALLLSLLVLLAVLFVRRAWIARGGGTVELCVRLSTLVSGRGWSVGVGRFVGDELRWYRVFSLSLQPGRVLSRQSLTVHNRRTPDDRERLILADDWTIVHCGTPSGSVEIAMAMRTLAGFLSWVEAAPPGTSSGPSYWSKAS